MLISPGEWQSNIGLWNFILMFVESLMLFPVLPTQVSYQHWKFYSTFLCLWAQKGTKINLVHFSLWWSKCFCPTCGAFCLGLVMGKTLPPLCRLFQPKTEWACRGTGLGSDSVSLITNHFCSLLLQSAFGSSLIICFWGRKGLEISKMLLPRHRHAQPVAEQACRGVGLGGGGGSSSIMVMASPFLPQERPHIS